MLLKVADRLCAELGCAEGNARISGAHLSLDAGDPGKWGILSADDELLVAAIRQRLANVAAAVAAAPLEGAKQKAVNSALDGSELVMRGELAWGNTVDLLALMPSFIFLVTLPITGHGEALALSRRTSELIEALED